MDTATQITLPDEFPIDDIMIDEILSKLNGTPILVGWRGSLAHGMYIAPEEESGTDDKDIMVVVVAPTSHYLGLESFGSRGTQEIMDGQWDIVSYELKKYLSLLEQGNPNVLSLLWVDESTLIRETETGYLLREHRNLFAGKHLYNSFVGYAHAQAERMIRGEGSSGRGFMGAKRKELVKRYGYDTKNASHLIRLLRMGIEFLRTGYLQVDRSDIDANELIAIKQGKWTLEQVNAESNRLFALAKQAVTKSTLPETPDHNAISYLCERILKYHLVDSMISFSDHAYSTRSQ